MQHEEFHFVCWRDNDKYLPLSSFAQKKTMFLQVIHVYVAINITFFFFFSLKHERKYES